MKEFLGFGGYSRPAEGYFSWQHLVFVTSLMVIMTALAVFFGKKYKHSSKANRPLIAAAFLIDGFEIFKIAVLYLRSREITAFTHSLPLFLCSIQLITIPLAAFSKGRVREASLDFVMIFGLLGAVLGTYAAGQNYAAYPVLSMDNVVSGITHSISGFCALYIGISGQASMKKRNIWITFLILLFFCAAAYIANLTIEYNYMFLMAGDGTPYDILYNLVKGHPAVYPLSVVGLFLLYIFVFYQIYFAARKKARIAV